MISDSNIEDIIHKIWYQYENRILPLSIEISYLTAHKLINGQNGDPGFMNILWYLLYLNLLFCQSDIFHEDIFPPTASAVPSLTADEWISGQNRDPILISLKVRHFIYFNNLMG